MIQTIQADHINHSPIMPAFKPLSKLVVLAASAALLIGGCRSVSHVPAETTSGAQADVSSTASSPLVHDSKTSSRWPKRWGNNPNQRGTIIELDPADPLRPVHYSRYHQSRSTDIEYGDANQLAADLGITTGFKFKPEGPGSFVFVPNPKNESTPAVTKDSGKQSDSDLPDLAFKFVSATIAQESEVLNATMTDPKSGKKVQVVMTPMGEVHSSKPKRTSDEDHVELQRTWFTYRDPKQRKASAEPIGTIVLLPGIFGTPDPIVDALENYWHNKGYSILRMRSQPSRFTQHHEFRMQPGTAVMQAGAVARMNDDRVAEGAYATKAAVEYLPTKRPVLADKPTVLVGMSGGAMMLPTIYAYSPRLYSGAVLIAGGADFLRISIESNYKTWIDAITFDFDPDIEKVGKIDAENLDNFSHDYLLKSKLDAYHTATEMSDVPVLMLHASIDQAVPASSGDLLYQRLGQPERWSYPVGHELIFAGLPMQVVRIDKWIRKHVIDPHQIIETKAD